MNWIKITDCQPPKNKQVLITWMGYNIGVGGVLPVRRYRTSYWSGFSESVYDKKADYWCELSAPENIVKSDNNGKYAQLLDMLQELVSDISSDGTIRADYYSQRINELRGNNDQP